MNKFAHDVAQHVMEKLAISVRLHPNIIASAHMNPNSGENWIMSKLRGAMKDPGAHLKGMAESGDMGARIRRVRERVARRPNVDPRLLGEIDKLKAQAETMVGGVSASVPAIGRLFGKGLLAADHGARRAVSTADRARMSVLAHPEVTDKANKTTTFMVENADTLEAVTRLLMHSGLF